MRSIDSATTFQRIEWRVQLDRTYSNPFNPDEIAVDARFAGPGGWTMVLPAFWNPPRAGTPTEGLFIVRFAAPEAGSWTMRVTAKDDRGEFSSQPVHFEVRKGDSRGFVRRVPGNCRYFQFDSGEPYFIIGINLAWANGDEKLASYQRWFEKLGSVGANFARVWLGHPNFMTETAALGPGRYDADACAYYDALLVDAEQRGVQVMLTLNNYRDVRERDNWGPCIWPLMPYNAANGGPATRPIDFFNNPECQRLYRQRLRYTVARWSSFTSVMCWEFFNEQTFTELPIAPAWTIEMARYLKSIDPYQHLVSTSFGANAQREVWNAPEIDLTQDHIYPEQSTADCSPSVSTVALAGREFRKPHLVAELGIDPYGSDVKFDPDGAGTNLHNGLWSAMMSGSAGGSCLWWWDNYVEEKDLWRAFRGASEFSRQIAWNRRQFEPVQVSAPSSSETGAETFSDLLIPVYGNWGRSHGQPIDVLPNGQTSMGLAKYIYGPEKAELATPTVLRVDLPQPSKLVLRMVRVSDCAILRVLVDDVPKIDFPFSALPSATTQATTQPDVKEVRPNEFVREVNRDCELDLPAGKHTIELKNLGGDWVSLASAKLTGAKSSRYADLFVYALADAAAGEAIGWVHDPESNWSNDAKHVPPRTITGATMTLPMRSSGRFKVEWWDTRAGKIFARDEGEVADGAMKLAIPPVTRDVAFRLVRESPTPSGG